MTCLHEQCGVNWMTRNSQALKGHLLHAGMTHHCWKHTVVVLRWSQVRTFIPPPTRPPNIFMLATGTTPLCKGKSVWGNRGIAPLFLTSALDGGERSASRPCRFIPEGRAPGTHWIGGWVGPRAGLDAVKHRKISCPFKESNPEHVAISTELSRLHNGAFNFTGHFLFLRKHACEFNMLSACPPITFHVHIVYRRDVAGVHPNAELFNFTESIAIWRDHELLKWKRY
jgi:hypothetical protein